MITKQAGGQRARGGIYWSMSGGEFIAVPAEGGQLPGGAKDQYIKAPLPLVLLVAPVLGLAFAFFLPLSGLLVLVPFLANKARSTLSSGKVSAAHMASPRMMPGTSYLEPRSPSDGSRQGSDPAIPEEEKLVTLAQEIAEKRWKDQ